MSMLTHDKHYADDHNTKMFSKQYRNRIINCTDQNANGTRTNLCFKASPDYVCTVDQKYIRVAQLRSSTLVHCDL